MTTDGWSRVPLRWSVDLGHGGRWTSLRTATREWLWTNPDPSTAAARSVAVPHQAFVDAGGGEECLPTVRGTPDHGAAWSRPWSGRDDESCVDLASLGRLGRLGRLERRIRGRDGEAVEVGYTITGDPGTAFLHAVHLLVDVRAAGRIEVPEPASVVDVDHPETPLEWPSGLDRLGPDDGTAVCLLFRGCDRVLLIDGTDALALTWGSTVAAGLCSLLIWRNLRGWPADRPYRSIGIEPLLGRAAELDTADPRERVVLGPTGRLDWWLSIAALRRHGNFHPRAETAA